MNQTIVKHLLAAKQGCKRLMRSSLSVYRIGVMVNGS